MPLTWQGWPTAAAVSPPLAATFAETSPCWQPACIPYGAEGCSEVFCISCRTCVTYKTAQQARMYSRYAVRALA